MVNTNIDSRARVDLIDGFLGAGKTTFIRRYIRYLEEQGISYVVLENEFGAAGVDGRMLSGNVRELSGGCICCGQKVNFHDMLIELAEHVQRIIVEPSGIFNADDFFDIMDSPRVQEKAVCGMMLSIVDPFSLCDLSETDKQVLFSELISSGAILFSRTDRADESTLSDAQERLRDLLGILPPILDARRTPFPELMTYAPVRRAHKRMRTDHSTLFQCATFYPTDLYDEARLHRLAKMLFDGSAGEVLRVKGSFPAKNGLLMLNATPDSTDIFPCEGEAVFNVIGHRLKRKVIRAYLAENVAL